ncbi:MAG TPA: dihydrofolate reductase family protein [Solirubrobacteraceae bacterium]|nr:dihydrofolate reductase family protein [Solirubrobacteraceae bacterium]
MSEEGAAEFRRLLPQPTQTLTAPEAVEGLRTAAVGERPILALNMIASADGRIAVDGRSAPLSSAHDRALFHALRARSDAVMVAAGTVRAERYGPTIRNERTRAERAARGEPEQPIAVIVTRQVELDPQLPLLSDPDSHVVIVTASDRELARCAAQIEYIRSDTLREALVELGARDGVRRIICEGGPHLNASLASESLIDELFLSISPILVGGSDATVLAGDLLDEPQRLELLMLLSNDDELYAHYVSRSAS